MNKIPRTRERGCSPTSARSCHKWLAALHRLAIAGHVQAMESLIRLSMGRQVAARERKVAQAA